MSDELVTAATFRAPEEAYLAKAKLEGHGIACRVADEHSGSLLSGYVSAASVKLLVRHADAEMAAALLCEEAGP